MGSTIEENNFRSCLDCRNHADFREDPEQCCPGCLHRPHCLDRRLCPRQLGQQPGRLVHSLPDHMIMQLTSFQYAKLPLPTSSSVLRSALKSPSSTLSMSSTAPLSPLPPPRPRLSDTQ